MFNQFSLLIPEAELQAFCEKHAIRKLSLFGSILSSDFNSQSDIDLLVEYLPGQRITFLDMVEQETQLTSLLGRKVDLRTPMELSRHFRKAVLKDAQVIYEYEG
ncbi:MAG: nucleotidyltransferase domain-containing protein [Chloroflexi bacterium]|nr:nucleotidyltransferase domain-containing protein [Chloroflexota bacterium]MCC6896304.1 nucleotidyltransferase domain-containing protein [Anaerolineae bacterium]